MNDDITFSKSSVFVSFVAGGLTGAAVALLFAPESGQETRSLINKRMRDGVDRGRRVRERIASKGRAALEGASKGRKP